MTTKKQEENVLEAVAVQMNAANSIERVNKIYRQARNWSRYHCYFADACTPEKCTEINKKFKELKKEALIRLEVENEESRYYDCDNSSDVYSNNNRILRKGKQLDFRVGDDK